MREATTSLRNLYDQLDKTMLIISKGISPEGSMEDAIREVFDTLDTREATIQRQDAGEVLDRLEAALRPAPMEPPRG